MADQDTPSLPVAYLPSQGVNTYVDNTVIPPNQATECKNLLINIV